MRDEVIFFMDLVPSANEKDGFGDPVMQKQSSEMVFAEKRSIAQSEFYQAQTPGKKPEIKFIITDHLDYQDQEYLIYNGTRYKILRTYQKPGSDELEITCYGGVRDVSAAVSNKNQ